MRSSRTMARVDLSLVMRGEEAPVSVQGLEPLSVGWDRNRPGEPDTAKISLRSEALPVRLDLLEGVHVACWLFEHLDPSRCTMGDPGFYGVVESVRSDRAGARLDLECSDWTWFPAHHDMTEAALASLDVGRLVTLEALVGAMLRTMPGGASWQVVSVGGAGAVDPRAVTVRGQRKVTLPARKGAKGAPTTLTVAKSYLPTLLGAGKTTLWGAVSEVCALLGVIPEVGVTSAGGAAVYLLSAEEYQASRTFRPFERRGRRWREVTEGQGCDTLEEERQLLSGDGRRGSDVPDFVEVSSVDSGTGVRTVARWPQALEGVDRPVQGPAGALRGVYQTAHGVVSQAQCRELARVAWTDAQRRRSTGSLRLSRPWTDGGSPEDADVLSLAPGAVLAVYRPAEWATEADAARAFAGRTALAAAVERAEARDPEVAVWQVDAVQHAWSPTQGYSAHLELRRFLATQADVMLDPLDVNAADVELKPMTFRRRR